MQTSPSSHPQFLKAIALSCLIAGTLDISDALIFYGLRGVSPVRILQGIAVGLIGRGAFTMGARSALLGLLLHYFIATTWATIYIFASRRLPLSRRPFLWGGLYGLVVYIVMNYVVVPLSRIGPRPTPPPVPLINAIAALVFCIGIPIALIARRFIPHKSS
jgi:hypothetical protein